MKKITFLLCMLSLIFAGSLIGCSDAQYNPSTDQITNSSGAGPQAVDLGTSGDYAILSKTGISTEPTSTITGDIGLSPAATTFITGFALTPNKDGTGTYSDSTAYQAFSSQIVTGNVFAASMKGTNTDNSTLTSSNLTTAVSDMEAAYTDAAGKVGPDSTELGDGEIGGLTLAPGLYKWGTDVNISTDVTLAGSATDVWIFQVAGGITVAPDKKVLLEGGALPENIFWQSAGVVALNTTSHFEGIILSQSAITLNTGASINGRLLSQTEVTLKSSIVTAE